MTTHSRPALYVLKDTSRSVPAIDGAESFSFEALRSRLVGRGLPRLLFRYRSAALLTYRYDVLYRPLRQAVLLRLLSRGPCWFEDDEGRRVPVTTGLLASLTGRAMRDLVGLPRLRSRVAKRVAALAHESRRELRRVRRGGRPIYLRTDLVFDNRAGGSVGHIAGVLNAWNTLDASFAPPLFITTDLIPTVRPGIETRLLPMPAGYRFDVDRYELGFTLASEGFLERALDGLTPAFVYQRYSRANFSGLLLARHAGVPLVLEFNGPEGWVSRHWGTPLRYGALVEEVELLNLKAAEVVVVVSRVLKDDLVARGIDEARILVNPNGVDPERYSPAVSGQAVRERHSLGHARVIGFIGTFGRWHGAEVLAEAFGLLLERHPELRGRAKLLMIGSGMMLPSTRQKVTERGLDAEVVFTGLIPQEQGPEHLAACDVLVAPHVANPDGSAFFGSPTKLFEYMAMGKGIVASRLGQIAEVLDDGRTALLTAPGDPEALADGLLRLVQDDRLREDLGRAARDEVLRRYSWKEHVRRTVDRLLELCG
jgi:glycosyltransferase involved in cell wall biosynthesis